MVENKPLCPDAAEDAKDGLILIFSRTLTTMSCEWCSAAGSRLSCGPWTLMRGS